MVEVERKINQNLSSEQLKSKIREKLQHIKKKLTTLKSDLTNNMETKSSKIAIDYSSFIHKLKDKSQEYIDKKEKKINNKEILSYEYYQFIQKLKELEKFNKNLTDIVMNSIENYNNFLIDKLPYYKGSATKYIINQSEKLSNNNIFSKLSQKQANKVVNNLRNRSIIYLINEKYPLTLNLMPSDNVLEEKSFLDSFATSKNNKIVLDFFTDEEFNLNFNKDIINEHNKIPQNEILFENCEFKDIDLSTIPYDLNNLKITNSKISYTIFKNIQFNNLISLNLDNNNLDTEHFENIFTSLLKRDSQSCNNLKILSAKNNYISRIIKNDEFKRINNKFTNLEIFNLSNNMICDVNKKLLDLIPNIKIFDLSNNSICQEYKCKYLINNCKGMVVLIRNIGIMKEPLVSNYRDYYLKKLTKSNYPIYSINLECLFYKRNFDNFSNINLSTFKKNPNILEINLSSCNLEDQVIANFIENCSALNNNISKINISNNLLSEVFFDLILKDNINILLHNLEELDLSYNSINFNGNPKYKGDTSEISKNQFIVFLNNFKNLKLLIMKGTPFENKFNEYVKKEVNIYYEKERHMKVNPLTGELLEIKEIIEKRFLEINPDFYLKINYLLSSKYLKRVKIMQSDLLLYHLIIENIM